MRQIDILDRVRRTLVDNRLGPGHSVLYLCLYQECLRQGGGDEFRVHARNIQDAAGIGRTSYYRFMKELERYGYLRYFPSASTAVGCWVVLNNG